MLTDGKHTNNAHAGAFFFGHVTRDTLYSIGLADVASVVRYVLSCSFLLPLFVMPPPLHPLLVRCTLTLVNPSRTTR